MKRFLIILFIGLSCDLNVFSQDYVRFYDSISNTPLSYTQIVINNQIVAISDEDGYLAKDAFECKNQMVIISNYGYHKIKIFCDSLMTSKKIFLTQKTNYLTAVEVTYKDASPKIKTLKKQKKKRYFAEYYYKLKLFDDKHRLIFEADMVVDVYDNGKNTDYPYELKFKAKRESKLNVKENKLDAIGNKVHVENELADLLWLNKVRNEDTYKNNQNLIKTAVVDDTTFLYLKNKYDRVISNETSIKVYEDSVFFFESKYVMKEELLDNYKTYYKDKKPKSYMPISKGFFYYINYSVQYSQIKRFKHIPKYYSYVNKVELRESKKSNSKIKYNMFYLEKSLELIRVLDLDLVKETTFNKENHLNYEPVGIIPSSHPYLDTIPLPKV